MVARQLCYWCWVFSLSLSLPLIAVFCVAGRTGRNQRTVCHLYSQGRENVMVTLDWFSLFCFRLVSRPSQKANYQSRFHRVVHASNSLSLSSSWADHTGMKARSSVFVTIPYLKDPVPPCQNEQKDTREREREINAMIRYVEPTWPDVKILFSFLILLCPTLCSADVYMLII